MCPPRPTHPIHSPASPPTPHQIIHQTSAPLSLAEYEATRHTTATGDAGDGNDDGGSDSDGVGEEGEEEMIARESAMATVVVPPGAYAVTVGGFVGVLFGVCRVHVCMRVTVGVCVWVLVGVFYVFFRCVRWVLVLVCLTLVSDPFHPSPHHGRPNPTMTTTTTQVWSPLLSPDPKRSTPSELLAGLRGLGRPSTLGGALPKWAVLMLRSGRFAGAVFEVGGVCFSWFGGGGGDVICACVWVPGMHAHTHPSLSHPTTPTYQPHPQTTGPPGAGAQGLPALHAAGQAGREPEQL